ncbi:MAG: hypothetical protein JST68_13985 [Bacteroidetes bacterium]|nr:hypothetical protein [Bacteroidota bacterium]
MRPLSLIICLVFCLKGQAQSTPAGGPPGGAPDSIKVLIIYGSKPIKGHPEERKWFGGRPGGHVVIQFSPDSVISFSPTRYRPVCHIFSRSKPDNFKSHFRIETPERFWRTFNCRKPRGMIISIPITPAQKQKLDSITATYLTNTPYDYAVFGMRCASASYEIIAQLGLLDKPYKRKIWWHLLYPRDIRYELVKEAKHGSTGHAWRVEYLEGLETRKWDWDRRVD